ncbi:MAG: T9SS type A sorting domain-containing protein, partial [Saprospiraceae bacterium]|nr:T9SS type A sorting domain-containing protein [Saprospiraceae bacterium]
LLDSLVATADSLQFIAIKIGDINCSIVPEPANLLQQDIEDRWVATSAKRLQAMDTWCTKGRSYKLAVKLPAGVEEMQGGQFALQWPSAALSLNDVSLSSDGARELHTAQLKENKVAVSWSNTRQQVGIPGNLLELSFTAHESGYLSNWISLDESEIKAEIVTNSGQSQSIGLDFILEAARPQLFQNSPNPAQDETTISFYLPTPAKAAIIVQTPAGQVISRVEDTYEAGYHSLQLRQENLPATGVLLYTLETAGYKSTRKMVILNR